MDTGDTLDLTVPKITRTTLALYAGASGDHNPVHIDMDACAAVGIPDVFAHGMLSMAYLDDFSPITTSRGASVPSLSGFPRSPR